MSVSSHDALGNRLPEVDVYLKVIDPPDEAPYTNLLSNPLSHVGDNGGPVALLESLRLSAVEGYPGVYTGKTDEHGLLEFDFTLPPGTPAGNNYKIEASYRAYFPPAESWSSGTMTAWKRVIVEMQRMLKNGLFLTRDAPVGSSEIYVRGNAYLGNTGKNKLSAGDRIILLHAPILTGSDAEKSWYSEEHTILQVVALADNEYRVRLGTKSGKTELPVQLVHAFSPDPTQPALGDAISLLSSETLSPADYHYVSPDLAINLFSEAYVDCQVFSTNGNVPTPFWVSESDNQPLMQDFVKKWSTISRADDGSQIVRPNYQMLIVADTASATAAGVTLHRIAGETSSWVYRETIEDIAPNGAADTWARKTLSHELAHQWSPNWDTFDPLWMDHCDSHTTSYGSTAQSPVYCLLAQHSEETSGSQRGNGIAEFHLVPHPVAHSGMFGQWHSEYFEIRLRTDPFLPRGAQP